MTNPAPSSGGMPKWLIILLVVFLVMILGCCGGVTTCFFLARKAAKSGVARLQEAAQEAQRDAQAARANGGNTMQVPTADGAATPSANNGTTTPPGTPTTPTDGAAATPIPGVKLPTGFPSDVPIQSGLAVTMPSWDNMTNTGGVLLSGNVKSDDVVTYYSTNLPQNGWTQTGNNSVVNVTLLQYTKDTRKLVVQVSPANNGAAANVMITVTKKE